MDLGNPFETIVHYLLIGEMTRLGSGDGFPMVSAPMHVYILNWTHGEL